MSDKREFQTVGYTAGSDEHDTPVEFFRPIAEAVGGFDLDPAASDTSNLADVNWTKEDNGLSQPWFGDVWLNPPYSDVSDWVERARLEYEYQNADRIVALVFARTSTQWFHKNAVSASAACFVEGRLTFGGANNSAPAPSMVLVWGGVNKELARVLQRKGECVRWGEFEHE